MLYSTNLVYYQDPYQTSLKTDILRIDEEKNSLIIYLDSTIFYPFGGGQPSDQGTILSKNGKAKVKNVQMKDSVVRHECTLLEGTIDPDDEVTLELDWQRRYKNMRVHTAGHIIHDVLMDLVEGLTPLRGSHGSDPYLEYKSATPLDPSIREQLEVVVNQTIAEDRPVVTRETSLEELQKIAKFIPPNLPKDKPLRIMQIEGYSAMPDGGTQVHNLKEIGTVQITSVNINKDVTVIKYHVLDA